MNADIHYQINVAPIDVNVSNEDKIAIQLEIQQKMNAMNGIFVELDAEEVDAIQDILDEEDPEEDDIIFTLIGTPFPLPFDSKINFDTLEVAEGNDNSMPSHMESNMSVVLRKTTLSDQVQNDYDGIEVTNDIEEPMPNPMESNMSVGSRETPLFDHAQSDYVAIEATKDKEETMTCSSESNISEVSREFPSCDHAHNNYKAFGATEDKGETDTSVSSRESPSSRFDLNSSNQFDLDLWRTQMGPVNLFQKSVAENVFDKNNISSHLDIIHYHFEGKCIIVSWFPTLITESIAYSIKYVLMPDISRLHKINRTAVHSYSLNRMCA